MRRRTSHLPWLACAAVAAVGIPGFAHGGSRAPGSINAVDFEFVNPATAGTEVAINAGETVTFSYPSGGNVHNVNFTGPAPTTCVQTAGANMGAVPPLPTTPSPAGWAGNCRFDAPGTYGFVCDAHAFMVGQVVVAAATPTPTPTPTPTSIPTPTGPAADELKLARTQRGQAVKGSIAVARAGSRINVKVLAKPSALSRKGRARVRVGSLTRPANAGTARFSVTLSRAARRALKRRGRLALTVRITVTPPSGTPFRAKKPVTLNR